MISERRSQHTQDSIDIWRSYDPCNVVALITWTTPHYIFQPLEEVVTLQDEAFKIMKNQPVKKSGYKRYKQIMQEMGSIGSYTGRDITFGKNGWHPHRHGLEFTIWAPVEQLKKWRVELGIAFSKAFIKAGGAINDMDAFMKRAVKIDQINDDDGFTRVSSYIAKVEGSNWTIAQETTKGIVKTAKEGNITPFGMLEAIRGNHPDSAFYSAKFYEYATTMHGKRQFFPTPGLNKFFNLDWKTDDDLMKEAKTGNHYSFITDEQWQQIIALDIRGEILNITEGRNEFEFMGCLDLVLDGLKEQKKRA